MKEIKAAYAIIKRGDKAVAEILKNLGIKTINIPLAGDRLLLVNPFEEVEGGLTCYITHSNAELNELYENEGAFHLATAVSEGYFIFITSLVT